jgi:hypothetical protein
MLEMRTWTPFYLASELLNEALGVAEAFVADTPAVLASWQGEHIGVCWPVSFIACRNLSNTMRCMPNRSPWRRGSNLDLSIHISICKNMRSKPVIP